MSGGRDRLRPFSSSNSGFWSASSSRDAREFARRQEREGRRHHEFLKETKSRDRKHISSDSSTSRGRKHTSSDSTPGYNISHTEPFDPYPWTDNPILNRLTREEVLRRLSELECHPGCPWLKSKPVDPKEYDPYWHLNHLWLCKTHKHPWQRLEITINPYQGIPFGMEEFGKDEWSGSDSDLFNDTASDDFFTKALEELRDHPGAFKS